LFVFSDDAYRSPHAGNLHSRRSLAQEKRFVLRSLKDRLRKFNISVAECGHQDLWQRSTLGIVSISSDHLILEQTLNTVVEETEKIIAGSLSSYQIEYL
jgi:uncharacterized protein YlxP (DUF503 family)